MAEQEKALCDWTAQRLLRQNRRKPSMAEQEKAQYGRTGESSVWMNSTDAGMAEQDKAQHDKTGKSQYGRSPSPIWYWYSIRLKCKNWAVISVSFSNLLGAGGCSQGSDPGYNRVKDCFFHLLWVKTFIPLITRNPFWACSSQTSKHFFSPNYRPAMFSVSC